MKRRVILQVVAVLAFIITGCGGGSGSGSGGSGSSNSDVSPGYSKVDACNYLSNGMYAFKSWATFNATTNSASDDTDFDGNAKLRELKIDSSNNLQLKQYSYASSTPTLAANKDSSNSAWNTPAKTYIVDISNGTRVARGDIIIVPATKISCSNNYATFSINGGLVKYKMQINEKDISGQSIVSQYEFVRQELTNPNQTFASGSKLLEGVATYLTKTYDMKSDDSKSKVTNNSGASLAGIDLTNIPNGQVFKFDSQKLTLNSNNTHTFVDSNGNSHTGSWSLHGAANKYITASNTTGNNQCRYYFMVISGELRYGTECDAGTKHKFGNNTNEDFMKEFSVNSVAKDSIINNLHN